MLKCTTKSKTNETILPSAVMHKKLKNDGSGISGLNLPAISPNTIILNFLCITTVVLVFNDFFKVFVPCSIW